MAKKGKSEQAGVPLLLGRAANNLLMPYKTPHVAVTGDVPCSRLEIEVIDNPQFQRLRRIKQLGAAFLVYPTALHTRFDHSIGTLGEAQRIISSVNRNSQDGGSDPIRDEEQIIIRLAALLHDFTHIPFGHTLEEETGVIVPGHDRDSERQELFLGRRSLIGRHVLESCGEEGYQKLMKILWVQHEQVSELGDLAYMADIVHNTLCADLLDYIKRDLYFCGLPGQVGERFLRYLFVASVPHTDGSQAKRLIVRLWKKKGEREYPRRDILDELVELLRIRFLLAERVYFHHAKIAADAMISRAVWEVLNTDPLGKSFPKEKLYQVGDDELLWLLAEGGKESGFGEVTQRLATNVRERCLHKRIDFLSRARALGEGIHLSDIEQRFLSDTSNRIDVENEISNLLGVRDGDVLIHCPPVEMNKKHAKMLVTWGSGHPPRELMSIEEGEDLAASKALKAILDSHDALWGVSLLSTSAIEEDPDLARVAAEMFKLHVLNKTDTASLRIPILERVLREARELNPSQDILERVVEEMAQKARLPRGMKYTEDTTGDWIRKRVADLKKVKIEQGGL
jgi:hypothetical protein